jgi:hypothetical protein
MLCTTLALLRTFTPRRDQLVICGQQVNLIVFVDLSYGENLVMLGGESCSSRQPGGDNYILVY